MKESPNRFTRDSYAHRRKAWDDVLHWKADPRKRYECGLEDYIPAMFTIPENYTPVRYAAALLSAMDGGTYDTW